MPFKHTIRHNTVNNRTETTEVTEITETTWQGARNSFRQLQRPFTKTLKPQIYKTRNLHDRLRTCYKTNIDLQRDIRGVSKKIAV